MTCRLPPLLLAATLCIAARAAFADCDGWRLDGVAVWVSAAELQPRGVGGPRPGRAAAQLEVRPGPAGAWPRPTPVAVARPGWPAWPLLERKAAWLHGRHPRSSKGQGAGGSSERVCSEPAPADR